MKIALLEHIWQLLMVAAILLFATALYFFKRSKKRAATSRPAGRRSAVRHPRLKNAGRKSRYDDEEERPNYKPALILGSVIVILAGWLAASFLHPESAPPLAAPEPESGQAVESRDTGDRTAVSGSLSGLVASPASQAAADLFSQVNQAGGTPSLTVGAAAQPSDSRAEGTPETAPQNQRAAASGNAAPQAGNSAAAQPGARAGSPKPAAAAVPKPPASSGGLLSERNQNKPPSSASPSASQGPVPAVQTPVPSPPAAPAAAGPKPGASGQAAGVLSSSPGFTVSLGSFKNMKNAEDYRNKILAAGSPATVSETVQNGVTWYRVTSGGFSTNAEAMRHGQKLKDQGLVSGQFIVKPSSGGQ